jgi:hypothetical protein
LWNSGERLHIWSADGYDGWDQSVWACADTDDDQAKRREGYEEASGTSIPWRVIDAFVMVRLVEIIRNGAVDEVIDEALRRSGSLLLEENADTLRAALKQIKLEEPDPIR